MTNSEGSWIKLDVASGAHYCHDQEGEAWSLARDTDGIVYLQHELDATAVPGVEGAAGEEEGAAVVGAACANTPKGFDFTTAQQTPSFSAFGGAGGERGADDAASVQGLPGESQSKH